MTESVFEKFGEPIITPPLAMTGTADEMKKLIYIKDYKVWKKKEKELEKYLIIKM